ncbi:hypothetical protein DSO57_1021453 [Entomophthora muscae]|uniref:Uncharacterized protein n=1 Tax=Entomophthora muscae TaxID=34485 RepID=A0ACC2TE52_9FUNG|nr:hypothetical protein DSO57_1021453 [Entomophthora muscae]
MNNSPETVPFCRSKTQESWCQEFPDTYSCVINKLSPAINVKAPASTEQMSAANMQTSTVTKQTSTTNVQTSTVTSRYTPPP